VQPNFSRFRSTTRPRTNLSLAFDTIMAPTTRSSKRACTPPSNLDSGEHNTIKKTRLFYAFDHRGANEKLPQVARAQRVPVQTARDWIKQRDIIGSPAYRRTRRISKKLGRPSKISKSTIQSLLSDEQNPVRDQPCDGLNPKESSVLSNQR